MASLKIGIVGMGAAGRAFLPAIEKSDDFQLAAFVEANAALRQEAERETGAKGYPDVQALVAHPDIDAIYIATPTELHRAHAQIAFEAGKHVLTEKPMAVSLEDAQAMVVAADRAGRLLLVGHSHSYDAPIQAMRDIIESGRLGRVRMINTCDFTDWMFRPRRAEEFDVNLGGGVTFRQGSHQFDIIRLLGGGAVRSVRAQTFDWDPRRPSIGAHTVFMVFEDGASATAVYNGYGYFSTMELTGDITEWGFVETPDQRPKLKREPVNAAELAAKQKRAKTAIPAAAPYQPTFGLTVVSCERGDLRQSPGGILVYDENGCEEIIVATDKTPRDLVLAEFADAIQGRKAPVHTGKWGVANLEICLAAMESSKLGRELALHFQEPLPSR
ncbi:MULTISPECIES: Gfo/Idh/MocA family oxidoreductase [unclassified Beijerinckia]|uniref:Gfo/Idh/MocA family protein n=1 Tax=unclassified Beijerinckia TaxID=2638183 RepID=UPI000894C61A|nr:MULTISPECIES: Gfo/Idh/MocA family oxidoreductase [unclassified Beijerinckia]MDH7795543.1 phthalate 4,5-cis-dihydrodiol dehydrogenase [Beijerinckia sp. GAS462]SEC05898.1 phthalate 4,5-cis-dihydrodiol dehydrogenase [Beijerinckia sp. 28-YEA-48]